MKSDRILLRFGDLTLKGKNQVSFIRTLFNLLHEKLSDLNVEIENKHDHAFVILNDEDPTKVIERLDLVSGIHSYSLVYKVKEYNMDSLKEEALNYLKDKIKEETTFKIETKRSNKNFPLTSLEVSKVVSSYLLRNMKLLKTDVHNPKLTLRIDIKNEGMFIYDEQIRGLGGYPVGIAGKGLLMLSGGIDSPVAGILAMKQGVEIECIHYESTPLTSLESAQKVVDLVKIMAKFAPNSRIKLHMVPFKDIHMALLKNVPESYNITIMRRMMYRIATIIANKNDCLILINGESVGQVASQTLRSMNTINSVTNIPVIRPVATYDKLDIIALARKFNTFDISIKPFQDCCTVYVPKAPATQPKIEKALEYEAKADFKTLVEEACANTKTLIINKNFNYELMDYGFEVGEAIDAINKAK